MKCPWNNFEECLYKECPFYKVKEIVTIMSGVYKTIYECKRVYKENKK